MATGVRQKALRLPKLRRLRGPVFEACLVAATAAALSAVFVAVNLYYNHGALTAPLDDTYIHLQYAREIASGSFMRYFPGDPVSTGASSLLYPLILAVVYLVGVVGDGLFVFAVAFGIVCLAGSAVCVYLLGRRLATARLGLAAGLLTASSGPLLWAATSGMEVLLLGLLVVATLLCFSTELAQARFRLTPALATLTALARPEGLLFAVVISAAVIWTSAAAGRVRETGLKRRLALVCYALAPLLAAAGQALFYLLATGKPSATSLQAKSLLHVPLLYPPEFVSQTFTNLHAILGTFGGLSSVEYLFPGGLAVSALGACYLALARPALRPIGLSALVTGVVSIGAVSTLTTATWQHFRYLLAFVPLFLLFAVVGIYALRSALPRYGRLFTQVAVGLAAVSGLVSLPIWQARAGQESASIREGDVSAAYWIRDHVAPGVTVAVDDAGAIAYFSGHRTVDMAGLTNTLAEPARAGPGSLWEALEQMDPSRRPALFAIYNHWPVPMDQLKDAGFFNPSPLAEFDLEGTKHLTGCEGADVCQKVDIYQADWKLAHSGDLAQTQPPRALRDSIDVADLASERDHAYQVHEARTGLEPQTELRISSGSDGTRAADAGRRIVGGESFTLHNLVPGRPLVLAGRFQGLGQFEQLELSVNETDVGTWSMGANPAGWQELRYQVPPQLVKPSSQIRLRPASGVYGPFPDYWSFHYWAFQP